MNCSHKIDPRDKRCSHCGMSEMAIIESVMENKEFYCIHAWKEGRCIKCGFVCDHQIVRGSGVCQDCGKRCFHVAKEETVNHPAHYGGDTVYEAIKVIDAWQLSFCLGNAVKYISRCGKKPGVDAVEDLSKAVWYIQHEIDRIRGLPSLPVSDTLQER